MGNTKTKVGLSDEELEAFLEDEETPAKPTGADDPDDSSSDDDTDDDTGDTDDDDTDDADPLAGLTDAQRAAVDAKVTKANANARKWRLKATGKASPADIPAKQPVSNGSPAPSGAQPPAFDPEAFKAQLRQEIQSEATSRAQAEKLVTEATRSLVAAGIKLPEDRKARASALAKAVRLLDLDGVGPDDVDDEVEALKSEMPALFGAAPRKRTGGIGGPSRTNSGAKRPNPIAALFD